MSSLVSNGSSPEFSQNSTDVAEEYCGTTYAAKLLGLSVATVQSLVERGDIEAWKTRGGHRRISLSSINKYLLRQGPLGDGMTRDLRQRLQVLVVEDDELTRELYTCYFDAWNLPVDCQLMSSALDALIDIASIRPDLLITDLRMAGVDGIAMLKVLKRNRQLSAMQVLVVSGMEREFVDDSGGLPEGALFLKKPLNFEWLHGYVTAMLARKVRA